MKGPRHSIGLVALTLSFLLVSCNGETLTTSTADNTEPPPTSTAPTTTTPTTTTTVPMDAAPPEMRGTWRTEITSDDIVFLTLNGISYGVTRGPGSASGKISVAGNEIRFFGGSGCPNEGFYTWERDGDNLTFSVAEGGDPCGGRRPILDGVTYELRSGG